jgi:hypothetical protein
MSGSNSEHPFVTGRESVLVLCNDLSDNVPLQGPTKEYPFFMAFRSNQPIAFVGNMAALTEDFYKRIKQFPVQPDLQKELLDVFKNYMRE